MKHLSAIIMALSILAAGPARAEGEHQRRVAAELLILRGDLRLLHGQPAPSARHKKGLNDRMLGGLAGLGLLARLADEARASPPRPLRDVGSIVIKLRTALRNNDAADAGKVLAALIADYPLAATGILPATPTPIRLKRAREIHQTTCAGCHDEPDTEVERPAYNLFKQSRHMSLPEFTARMIIGVRGDAVTGLGNPLMDEEIAALIAYYRSEP